MLNYYIEMYLCEGTEVYVMRCPDGQEDVEGMNGKVAAIRLSGGTAYRTPRGLTVGDTAYRAWLLYGKCAFTSSFIISGRRLCQHNRLPHSVLGKQLLIQIKI